MKNSKQISDFPQSSDFTGDQRICNCRKLRNGLPRDLSLQKRISHSNEKSYKCSEFGKTFSPSLYLIDQCFCWRSTWHADKWHHCEQTVILSVTQQALGPLKGIGEFSLEPNNNLLLSCIIKASALAKLQEFLQTSSTSRVGTNINTFVSLIRTRKQIYLVCRCAHKLCLKL